MTNTRLPVAGPSPSRLLEIENLSVHFSRSGKLMRAVDGVSLHVAAGETLGLVGESGSGKTTIGRALLRLLPEANTEWQGSIRYQGTDLASLSRAGMRGMRGRMQMIFQDPVSSFNPRRRIEDIVAEGLVIQGVPKAERRRRVEAALADVGFALADVAGRKPHQFSGGQCQRIAIARALAVQPDLIVCDEPVASLDVSIQAQILNLFLDLRRDLGLTCLFISHDLSVVRHVSDRVAIMYLGRIVEAGTAATVYASPRHPYTQGLLDSVPKLRLSIEDVASFKPIAGELPSPLSPPTGCAFHPRCPKATALCRAERPALTARDDGTLVACHHA